MRRRDAVAAAGGLAVLGAAGLYALEGDAPGRAATGADGTPTGSATGLDPVTVETLEAPHSSAGRMTVPVPDQVTVVDLFATWCSACDEHLATLAEVHDRVADDVAFVSVTNQAMGGGLTREDVREFWREKGGPWPVALDDEGRLTSRLGASGLPYTAVTDRDGRVAYAESGVASADAVESVVERASDR